MIGEQLAEPSRTRITPGAARRKPTAVAVRRGSWLTGNADILKVDECAVRWALASTSRALFIADGGNERGAAAGREC